MSKSIPKSLLSAYFDGEASSEERAAVSRIAYETPEVQQTLDDYAQLSQSLKSLHRDVPHPQLRDAVIAAIQPVSQPAVTTPSPWWRRHWMKAAGGVLAVAAAGLVLMLLPAGRDNQIAMNEAAPQAESVADLPSDRDFGALAMRAASAPSPANDSPIPEEWFTQQVANGQTPQPGDFMQYILREADETVVIPVTVVDVQRTAGEIRVLLKRHGIQPLGERDASVVSGIDDSAVAILVESDWDRFPAVMEDLEIQGMRVTALMEFSQTPRRSAVGQDLRKPEKDSAHLAARSAQSETNTTGDEAAEGGDAARTEDESLASQAGASSRSGLFVEAQVTDEFVEQLGQRQQETSDREAVPEIAESSAASELRSNADVAEPPAASAREFWQPFASHGPGRVVFLIKKSGTSP